ADGKDGRKAAADPAQPARAEAGDKAEGGHSEVVEGVFERVTLEWRVDARHHHEHHQRLCDDRRYEPERRAVAEPSREGGKRSDQQPEYDTEEEVAGVVEMVVTGARLGGIDDLREEGRQSEYAGREPHGELGRSREGHASRP